MTRLSWASTGVGSNGFSGSDMAIVHCPDCGAVIELPPRVKSGDLVECPNCAGHLLRVREDGGTWSATLAHLASCPNCDELLTLPEDVKPGDLIHCCGRDYRVTFEYGAFAAEEVSR